MPRAFVQQRKDLPTQELMAALRDRMQLRKLSKGEKSIIEQHRRHCDLCMRHKAFPDEFPECPNVEWYRHIGIHTSVPSDSPDRRMPDSIQVVEVKGNWTDSIVVIITAVSSFQIWTYNVGGYEHLQYHSYSDIE